MKRLTIIMQLLLKITLDREFVLPRATITGVVKVKGVDDIQVEHFYIEIFGIAECSWEEDIRWYNYFIKPKAMIKPLFRHKGRKSVNELEMNENGILHNNRTGNDTGDKNKEKSQHKRNSKVIFQGEQEFFHCRHTLDGGDGGNTVFERRTNHLFPFKCRLPGHLPATWAGIYGTIRYFCRTTLHYSNGLPSHIALHPVIVLQHRDLKLERYLLNEARKDVKREFKYTLIKLGYVEISIWMPFCGIAAGQKIPLICTINNKSAMRFNGITFILTKIEIYRSTTPYKKHKLFRTDICRIPRLTDIVDGVIEFFAVLQTNKNTYPTSQFWKCSNCQVTYEIWISLCNPLPDMSKYGYPNFDTPGIPIIIGTEPICSWDSNKMTMRVMQALMDSHPPIVMEPPPPDEVVEEMLNTVEEDMDVDTINNLGRQIDINENLVDS